MIDLEFVSGFDGVDGSIVHPDARDLNYRFAVIQQTYVRDEPDTSFSEALWRVLVRFIESRGSGSLAVTEQGQAFEVGLDQFLASWNAIEPKDRDAPRLVILREGAEIELIMATEYWCECGGPWPYADSYTYAFHTRTDISKALIHFLFDEGGSAWALPDRILVTSGRSRWTSIPIAGPPPA